MGTWNTKIDGNDTFQDIYQEFFGLYNEGQNPVEVSKQVRSDSADMFDDHDDKYNYRFALALAQWETKCLDAKLFEEIKDIVETGKEIELWLDFGADSQTVQKRRAELAAFLAKISVERNKPKRRSWKKFDFEAKRIVSIIAPDNIREFYVSEEYVDKKYIHTSGLLMRGSNGGSILYFEGEGKHISAKWLSNTILEITHDQTIAFSKKETTANDIHIIYKEQ